MPSRSCSSGTWGIAVGRRVVQTTFSTPHSLGRMSGGGGRPPACGLASQRCRKAAACCSISRSRGVWLLKAGGSLGATRLACLRRSTLALALPLAACSSGCSSRSCGPAAEATGVSVQGGEPSPSRCSASQSPPYLDGVQRYRLRDIPDAGAVFDLLCGHVELMQRMATLQV